MINNYSKKLLSPIKGKKYSHQHIMQMLCVYQLKQTLALGDVNSLPDGTMWTLRHVGGSSLR